MIRFTSNLMFVIVCAMLIGSFVALVWAGMGN